MFGLFKKKKKVNPIGNIIGNLQDMYSTREARDLMVNKYKSYFDYTKDLLDEEIIYLNITRWKKNHDLAIFLIDKEGMVYLNGIDMNDEEKIKKSMQYFSDLGPCTTFFEFRADGELKLRPSWIDLNEIEMHMFL